MTDEKYGETWVYESIVGAVPGISVSDTTAVALQFLLFEALLVAVAAWYGLWSALVAGTVAIGVAALGSAVMLVLGRRIREYDTPRTYRRLLFSSQIEVVLGLLAFIAAVVYLLVYDPRAGEPTLVTALAGETPPLPAVYLGLLVLWDLCYRIGIGWWASVANLVLAVRYRGALSPAARASFRQLNLLVVGYAVAQLLLVPFVLDHPFLLVAIVGHVLAVAVVAGAATLFLGRGDPRSSARVSE